MINSENIAPKIVSLYIGLHCTLSLDGRLSQYMLKSHTQKYHIAISHQYGIYANAREMKAS